MKFTAILGIVAATFFSTANAENVVPLGDSDFDDHIKQYKYVLAEFYAPWCGHCKSLAPEYEKAATAMKDVEVEGGLSIVSVDATEHKELATRFGVQGFPTLKWIVNGEDSDYQGGRTKDEIVAWLNKKTGPPAVVLADVAAFNAFKDDNQVAAFGFFASEADAKEFLAAAETDDEVPYGYSTSEAVRDAAGLSASGVVVFRNFEAPDEPRIECEGADKEAIKTCVSSNNLPLIVPFSQENAPKIFGGSIKQHCLIFLDGATQTDSVIPSVRPVASTYKGEYLFVTVDKSDDRILEFFGITEGDLPTARIVFMGDEGMKKFEIEGAGVSEDQLAKFVAAHKAGDLAPALKSEDDIADEDQKENVWVLTGKNHDRVVAYDKNVLVEYYAPWCGHCKKLAPEYEKVAEHFKDDDSVIIAKMDSTANEVESVSVSGFPTLKFFAKGSSEPVDFDGGRDFDGIKEFLEKNKL